METILLQCSGSVAHVTLNRPERLNAINRQMLSELSLVMDRIEADAELRVVIISGSGRAFSSGFDLKEQMESNPTGVAAWRELLRQDFEVVMRMWDSTKPTIAAVRGHCLAGAFELALACDITIAGDDAVFGEPELKFGAGIVVMLLPWLVGPKKAKEIILAGIDDIDAATAFGLGIVNRVVPSADVMQTAQALARRIATIDPALIRQTKRAINRAFAIMGLHEALEAASDINLHIEAEGSPDKREFMDLARRSGLRAALKWRESRF